MQENYMISIVGKQQMDGETGEIRIDTLGSYVKKGDHWYIAYKPLYFQGILMHI